MNSDDQLCTIDWQAYYSASSVKVQQFADRSYVSSLGQIIPFCSQPVFALTSDYFEE